MMKSTNRKLQKCLNVLTKNVNLQNINIDYPTALSNGQIIHSNVQIMNYKYTGLLYAKHLASFLFVQICKYNIYY